MLLVLDVGNTNIVLGVYDGEKLRASWRLSTQMTRTVDEFALTLRGLLEDSPIRRGQLDAAIVSSVVPPLDAVLRAGLEKFLGAPPMFIGPGLKTGVSVRYEPPGDVGADRIVNAVAAIERYGAPVVVVDFGTATTFDVISEKREYLGGIITPGLGIASEALFARTARLPRVEIKAPEKLVGSTTVGSIQSGLYYGYLGLVDGILGRLKKEMGAKVRIVATGGLSELLARDSQHIQEVAPDLTLDGLRRIWEKNRPEKRSREAVGKKA